MTHAAKVIEEFEKKLDNIKKMYAEACEYYLLDKGDEKCTNSQEFFKFFTGFIDQVIKSMPKEEKKRAAAKVGGAGGPARKIGQKIGPAGGMDLVNELKMKQT